MKENILFFYKGSHGELHAGLPILIEILSKRNNVTIYFIYQDEDLYKSLPSFYKQIIKENFKVFFITKKQLIPFYIKHFYSKNYIFTCDTGHNLYTKLLTFYWPFSRVIFYHHAYALLNGEIEKKQIENLVDFDERYNGGHHQPLLIAHNETEIKYREKVGFKTDNIVIAGNLGYDKKWMNILKNNSGSLDELVNDKKSYEKVIFIPTRDIHRKYLSKENSDYLLMSLDTIISDYPKYLFLLKPHPRQRNINEYINLKEKYENCKITDISTITASEESDLVVSYWSSAITDALAVNTPVIEFHRHEDWHFQLVNTDKGLVSLYHYLGLCPFYTNVDDVKSLLEDVNSWDELRYKQQKEFNKIFLKRYPEFTDNLFNRLEHSPLQVTNFIKSSIETSLNIIKNKINVF